MVSFLSNKPDSPRATVEKGLAQEFLSILERHHREVRRINGDEAITVRERTILSRTTYQNWTLGLAAGVLTFGVLVGVTARSAAAASRYKLPQRAPSAFRELDVGRVAPKAGRRKRRQEPALEIGQPNEAMDPTSHKSEVMSQGEELQRVDRVEAIPCLLHLILTFSPILSQSNSWSMVPLPW